MKDIIFLFKGGGGEWMTKYSSIKEWKDVRKTGGINRKITLHLEGREIEKNKIKS